DVVLCQLYPEYAQALSLFRRALDQRNSSLRAIREGRSGPAELRPWLEPLVQYGALVMSHRERYLQEAGPLAQRAAGRIGERTPLELRYLPGTRGAAGEGWPERLLSALREAEEEEVARGQTVVGPQRDDFEIAYADRPARQYASQGQQRTAVLALKAAEVSQHLAEGGQSPVVLLDDVLSELDRDHRRGLLEVLGEGMGVEQALVTATEDSGLEEAIGPSQVLLVGGGEVRGEAGR
ncbi:MAG: DNA replication/repair protein RecF, partial [Candidatus Dormibacteria bacterium]